MAKPIKTGDIEPLPLTHEEKFKALCMRYEDHVELLRAMTGLDYRLFGGVMTIQLALGGWLVTKPVESWPALIGILVADAALVTIGAILLRNNTLRRKEAVGTLKNIIAVLGFYRNGFYSNGLTINAPGDFRLWGPWYIRGIVIAYFGLATAAIATRIYI